MSGDLQGFNSLPVDRLVDGELSPVERRQLLLACEDNPHRWRDVALAFVELQVLTSELSALRSTCETVRWAAAEDAQAESGAGWIPDINGQQANRSAGESCQVESSEEKVTPSESLQPPKSSDPGVRSWGKFLGLAAALAISLSLGFGIGTVANRMALDQAAAGLASSRTAVSDPLADSGKQTPESLYMFVQDAPDAPLKSLEIPIVDSRGEGMESLLSSGTVPEEVVRMLRRQGHRIEQTRRLYPVDLPDGRTIVVPVDDIRVNFEVFQ
jgi:hypothetical protein